MINFVIDIEERPTVPPALISGIDHLNPGVDRLHIEILWAIFDLNSNVGDERPLETARYTSQVCSLWRRLVITYSAIWGRILDLSGLQVEKDVSPWRDLVMERTGSTPLFIKGEIPIDRVQWFLDFTATHWERVCYLDVQPIGTTTADNTFQDQTNFMNTPPRCIENLHFPRIQFNLKSSWVANLRGITLSSPFHATEIFDCLANMPRLEYAKIRDWTPDLIDGLPAFGRNLHRQTISSPRLTHLQLYHTFSEAAAFIQYLIPHNECAYIISTLEDPFCRPRHWTMLMGCLQRRLGLRNETTLDLNIRNRDIVLKIVGDPMTPAWLHIHSLELLSTISYPDAIGNYLDRLQSRNAVYQRVTGFAFHIDDDCQSLNQVYPNFLAFFWCFSSVSMLQLSERSLDVLAQISQRQDILFPLLKIVQLSVHNQQFDCKVETMLAQFLTKRRSSGKPVKQVNFMPGVGELGLNWEFLREFDDLKVVWIPGKETCVESKEEETPRSGI